MSRSRELLGRIVAVYEVHGVGRLDEFKVGQFVGIKRRLDLVRVVIDIENLRLIAVHPHVEVAEFEHVGIRDGIFEGDQANGAAVLGRGDVLRAGPSDHRTLGQR